MPQGCCSDVECWPLLPTAFTLFFFFSFCFLCCNLPILLQIYQAPNRAFKSCWSPVVSLCPCARSLLCTVELHCGHTCFSCCHQCQQQAGGAATAGAKPAWPCHSWEIAVLGTQVGQGTEGFPKLFPLQQPPNSPVKYSGSCCVSSAIERDFTSGMNWKKGLAHLWLFKSPLCSFFRRFMGFHGVVMFSWWELWKNSYSSA